MCVAGPRRARDRVCSRSQAGLGQEPTAGCSEDRLSPLPHGRSRCGRRLGGRYGHGAEALLRGGRRGLPAQAPSSTTRQHWKGAEPPAPQSHPWEFVPQLHLHLAGGPFEGSPTKAAHVTPGHSHATATLSQRNTCRRRSCQDTRSVAEATGRRAARLPRRRQTGTQVAFTYAPVRYSQDT